MTWWRWRQAGLVPEPVVIRGRNYYRADDLAKMQRALVNQRTGAIGSTARHLTGTKWTPRWLMADTLT